MAKIRAYTTIEQSRKLAEILPIKSADMWWSRCTITDFGDGALKVSYTVEPCNISQFRNTKEDIPCWSLAALLGVLPKYELYNFGDTIQLDVNLEAFATEGDETLLDLVVNMIIHLHDLKML